jgi:hypothetical protein
MHWLVHVLTVCCPSVIAWEYCALYEHRTDGTRAGTQLVVEALVWLVDVTELMVLEISILEVMELDDSEDVDDTIEDMVEDELAEQS